MSDKPTNCPNCGAPLKGGKCEYCGTIIHDVDSEIARLELEKQNGIYKPFPPYTGDSFL